jgi:hypothetical protein
VAGSLIKRRRAWGRAEVGTFSEPKLIVAFFIGCRYIEAAPFDLHAECRGSYGRCRATWPHKKNSPSRRAQTTSDEYVEVIK